MLRGTAAAAGHLAAGLGWDTEGLRSPSPPPCPSRGWLPARGPVNPSAEPATAAAAPAPAVGCSARAISAGIWPVRMLLRAASGPDNVYAGLVAETISFLKFHFQNLFLFHLSSQAAGEGKPGLRSCLPGASP